jgi:outer membrane biosynthesis protein TonB
MLPPGDGIETRFGAMNLRQIIPTDMTASALAHLSLLALVFLFSDVHPFGTVTAEPIAVDIVASQDIAEQVALDKAQPELPQVDKVPEPLTIPPPPQPSLTNNNAASAPAPAPAAKPVPPAKPQKQAALSAARPAAQPQPQPAPQQPAPPPQTAAPAPAYTQPEPDITLKYSVLLGLPPDIAPAPPSSGDKKGDNFDAAATQAADVASSVVADFRRHLRTCSKLPAALKDSDEVKVKLRVMMTPQGKLAAEPVLIEASASEKGPLLMRSAISALQACQPYAMLPVDRYGEWKVLDLSFTPKDFSQS